MKIQPIIATFISVSVFLSSLLLPLSSLAKEINLYEQPNTSTKVVGTVDLSSGIIPIFTPKGGDWIKIANRSNQPNKILSSQILNNRS